MENSINKDLSSIWNASRIIETLSEMIKLNIFKELSIETYEYDESNPSAIRYWRLLSVLRAYGKSPNSESLRSWLFYDFVSTTHSEKKLTEISKILKETTSPKNADSMNELIHSVMQNEDIHTLSNIFYKLFYTYLSYKKISDPFAGVIEISRPIFYTLQFVEQSSYKATHKLQENLKQLLVLLMGDDFDTPISEKELIEKYNYPPISDQELNNLIIEYSC